MRLQYRILWRLIPALLTAALVLGWLYHARLTAALERSTLSEMGTLLEQVSRRLADRLETAQSATTDRGIMRAVLDDVRFRDSGFLLTLDTEGAVQTGAASDTVVEAIEPWRLAGTSTSTGRGEINATVVIDGREHLARRTQVAGGLQLLAVLPRSELNRSSRQMALGIVASMLAVVGIVVALVSWLLRRTVVMPIRALEQATQRIREGDFSIEPAANRDDEIGKLGSALHEMTISLAQQRNALDVQAKVLTRTAYYDNLTGLPNRALFRKELERAVVTAERHGYCVALVFVDLDGFKRVNDTMGHDAGDQLLTKIARRLRACLRASDTVSRPFDGTLDDWTNDAGEELVSRLGGDEFTILISRLDHREDAASVARKLLSALNKPVLMNGQNVVTTPSVGIALFPDDGTDAEALLRSADTAMYEAKRLGKNRFEFYSADMGDIARKRLAMESRLRAALDSDSLELHYQPMHDWRKDRPVAVEALLRWTDDELGQVQPAEFVALAEEVGLIVPLGSWVLRTACKQLAAWRAQGFRELTLCVNVSSVQFSQAQFTAEVEAVLRRSGIPPSQLELELTERTVMDDTSSTLEELRKLHALGVHIAIDDFGTGYSSLAYLRRFPLTRLKVDKSFIGNIDDNMEDLSIVRAIVALAKTLNLSVVAEGVETESQRALLVGAGVDLLQGWLLAKAMPAEDVAHWLKARRVATT